MNIDDERRRFEEWCSHHGLARFEKNSLVRFHEHSPWRDEYIRSSVQSQWNAWQARAALAESDSKAVTAVTHQAEG